jgi:hypothetical protein
MKHQGDNDWYAVAAYLILQINYHSDTPRLQKSICIWLYSPLLDLGCFFNFLIFYTVGRTPWTGDQPVAGPLPT